MSDLLELGDKLIAKTAYGSSVFPITRVTKTLAMSKREDGYEHTFKREINYSMSHPRRKWDLTRYSVIPKPPTEDR